MTIAGDGGTRVDGPECRPSRFGLKSAANVTEKSGDEWARGLEWDQLECGYDPGIVSGQCPALPEQLKLSSRGFDTPYADAFAVYAGWECSAITAQADAWDNAEELMLRNWWRTLERTLWVGIDQDGNTVRSSLSDYEDLTPGGGALDIVSGVAALESFAGDCNDCEPLIHANRGLATYMAGRNLVERDGSQMRMIGTGSLFVPGAGYLADAPGGGAAVDAGEAWMVVSGGINITHGNTFFTPERDDLAGSVNRSINDITVYAERMAAFQVSCCIGAVRVTLDSCCG